MKLLGRFVYYLLLLGLGNSNPALAQVYPFQGKWICKSTDVNEPRAPLFRKSFLLGDKKISRANIRVCGLGQYVLSFNGKQLTSSGVEQDFTRYDARIYYQTYPVEDLILEGENVLAVELGNGWFNVQSRTIWNFDKIGWRQSPRLILDLVLDYQDGSRQIIASDESWKTAFGASSFNSMHAGEIYDARKEIPGWKHPDFKDVNWPRACLASPPGGLLVPHRQPLVRMIKKIKPIWMKKMGAGQYLYNLGENFAGVIRLKVKGIAGDTVRMVHDELLNSDGSLNTIQNSGQMIGAPQDPKFQTDIYVLKGNGVEEFIPRFTYHGFQYVELQVQPSMSLDLNSVQGQFLSTGFLRLGNFNSSDEMLNKLYAAAIQSYRSNFVGIPTDCPQREKMGWIADAYYGVDLGLWNFDASSAYENYLRSIRDVQQSDGKLPGIAPTRGIGFHWIDPNDDDFGPAWGSALPLIAWSIYLHSGKLEILSENYKACNAYVAYLNRKAALSGDLYLTGIADWQALEQTPKAFTSTAIYYHDLVLMEKMAALLGHMDDAEAYRRLAERTKSAFNLRFFDFKLNAYQVSTVTALSAALYYGLCPDGKAKTVAAKLAELIIAKNYKADFGIFGTKYVLRVLCDYGYADVAYRLLTNREAGWGKWIASGSSTLWEEWPGTTSHNHVYAGDYAAWFFEYLAGIKIDESHPGLSRFLLSPVFPDGLNRVQVIYRTASGKIEVSWKRRKSVIDIDLLIPKGTQATSLIPGNLKVLTEGRHHLVYR